MGGFGFNGCFHECACAYHGKATNQENKQHAVAMKSIAHSAQWHLVQPV
jgi:hypothetical protein